MRTVWATFKEDAGPLHQRIQAAMEAEDRLAESLREEETRRQHARERASTADPDGGLLGDKFITNKLRGGWLEHGRSLAISMFVSVA